MSTSAPSPHQTTPASGARSTPSKHRQSSIYIRIGLVGIALVEIGALILSFVTMTTASLANSEALADKQRFLTAPVIVITGLIWMKWQEHLSKSEALGTLGKVRAGRIIPGWLIPGVNLVLPYFTMTELVQALETRAQGRVVPRGLALAWWVTWVSAMATQLLQLRGLNVGLDVTRHVTLIVAAVLAFFVVAGIQRTASALEKSVDVSPASS